VGSTTIDPHSQKEHTEIHKIPKFSVNKASFTEIEPFKNAKITQKYLVIRTQGPDGQTFFC